LVLKNDAGEIILIPNTMALSEDVVNFSKNNTHQVIFDAEITSRNEIHLSKLEDSLVVVLDQYPDVVIKGGAQLNILERKPESLLIRYQFPIKSGEKPTEVVVKKALNQAFIDWNYALRQAELL
jgi:small-conductance mechanosensitive channel